jgi:hypothetical protein
MSRRIPRSGCGRPTCQAIQDGCRRSPNNTSHEVPPQTDETCWNRHRLERVNQLMKTASRFGRRQTITGSTRFVPPGFRDAALVSATAVTCTIHHPVILESWTAQAGFCHLGRGGFCFQPWSDSNHLTHPPRPGIVLRIAGPGRDAPALDELGVDLIGHEPPLEHLDRPEHNSLRPLRVRVEQRGWMP